MAFARIPKQLNYKQLKLRIKGNTIRVRLTQTEVTQLKQGQVKEQTTFPNGQTLHYILLKSNAFEISFKQNTLQVALPNKTVDNWATSDKVELKNQASLPNGGTLDISIEKDFKCLTERPHEDESDMYPNPLESHSKC